MTAPAGRHFLQIPGPTNVPDRILRAIERPTIDHRGPEFGRLGERVLSGLREVFRTRGDVLIFPSSGTGAWEAALVNTLSPGDTVLMSETGHFSTLWTAMARRLGLDVEVLEGDWRTGADPARIEARLTEDHDHFVKAVAVVHNETSTGVTSRIGAVRAALDAAGHPALLLVDTISSLASIDYRHDEWGVDVTVGGSQKGLMLPPGLGFNAVSEKALAASTSAGMARSYWDWEAMLGPNRAGFFPYTPATNLLYGLAEAIDMLLEEGLGNVFRRHDSHAEATRRAVRAWGMEVLCRRPDEYSSSLTAVRVPEGHSADALRRTILETFDMSLGNGLGRLADSVFRIGHLGAFNDLMLAGTLSGIEMGLHLAGVPYRRGGVDAALAYLAEAASRRTAAPAGRRDGQVSEDMPAGVAALRA
ncbi:MAG: aminotransferase class V-fold PLP-dependent enzyme [Gammaproteobacteria bacterium]|nr:aminotransferase class V-fold PLP-dependent enzyme [Gammaproteobacteria bacterium]